MSVDDSLLRDPRVALLARCFGWTRFEAMGRLLAVWAICYDRVAPNLRPAEIDVAAEQDGMAEAMLSVDLAASVSGGQGGGAGSVLRVSGAASRIEYLAKSKASGSIGGKKSGEVRRTSTKPFKGFRATPPGSSNLPDTAPDGVPVPDGVPEGVPSVPAAGHRQVVDAFDAAYRQAVGHAPTWGAKQGSQVKDLIGKHSPAEVIRRIGILFGSPPSWLKPPFDLGTLVQHFDKLAVSTTRDVRVGRAEAAKQAEFQDGEVDF